MKTHNFSVQEEEANDILNGDLQHVVERIDKQDISVDDLIVFVVWGETAPWHQERISHELSNRTYKITRVENGERKRGGIREDFAIVSFIET